MLKVYEGIFMGKLNELMSLIKKNTEV